VRLGRIVRPHGTAGEVAVRLESSVTPDRLVGATAWVVPPSTTGAIGRTIVAARSGPRGALITLEGITEPNTARELAGRWLLVREDLASMTARPEPDLSGYLVADMERGELGRIADVIVTGANDVLVVEGGRFGQVLIPVIEKVVLDVNHEDSTVRVALLDGLIDEADA